MKNNTTNKNSKQHREDPLAKLFSGVIVVWLGISLLLMEQNFFRYGEWWAYFLLGLGIIFFAEVIFRMTRDGHKKISIGKIIAGAVLMAIGASNIYHLEDWWPVILIAVGVIIIILNLQQKQEA